MPYNKSCLLNYNYNVIWNIVTDSIIKDDTRNEFLDGTSKNCLKKILNVYAKNIFEKAGNVSNSQAIEFQKKIEEFSNRNLSEAKEHFISRYIQTNFSHMSKEQFISYQKPFPEFDPLIAKQLEEDLWKKAEYENWEKTIASLLINIQNNSEPLNSSLDKSLYTPIPSYPKRKSDSLIFNDEPPKQKKSKTI